MTFHMLLIALTLLSAIGIGWSIGANDAANSMGTAVGSRVLTLRQAIIQISLFGLLGALLQGKHVTDTIGKGIVPLNTLAPDMAASVAMIAAFAACGWVVLATYFKMPISTSHSIVGAVAGAGLAIHAPIQWAVLKNIFICWIFTPLGAAILGLVLYYAINPVFTRMIPGRLAQPLLRWLIVLSGWYVAYSWGANDVANAVGVISGAGILTPLSAVALGGLAIVLGIVTWGYRVIETIGTSITSLLPVMAFAAQLASALNVHIYTLFGIPVSTSHSIVGAIFGVGLVRGLKLVNIGIMSEIVVCWLATPFVSGVLSFVGLKIMLRFVALQ
jgi:inorganic phosphate transporter, PiT family